MQNVPVWIVGNKADLCLNVLAQMRTHRHDHHHHNHRSFLHPTIQHHQLVSPYEDLTPACKEFSNLVRKHWKCNYLECSAKYNWRIMTIFRELLKSIDPIMTAQAEISSSQQPSAALPPTPTVKDSTIVKFGISNETVNLSSGRKQSISEPNVPSEHSDQRSNRICHIS